MVKLTELMAFFETVAPRALAEEYDNVGLLVAGAKEEIETVLLALDADEQTVFEAEKVGAQLVITHHPLIFRPLDRLTEEEGTQRTVRRLLQKGIGLFSMHTNFDAAEGGLCDVFLHAFGSFSTSTSFAGTKDGIGRIGQLTTPCTVKELLARGKTAFCSSGTIRYVGNPEATVQTVAVCNGGGGDLVYDAKKLGAEVYISGDFKHHHARFAYENGLNLIQIDHFNAEIGFCEEMAKRLLKAFGENLQVLTVQHQQNPWQNF